MVILCQKEKCGGVIAHVKGKAIEILRSKNSERTHRILILSSDASIMASCPRCFEATSILVENGKLNTEELTTQEETQNNVEEESAIAQ